jgi:hypothetical protein
MRNVVRIDYDCTTRCLLSSPHGWSIVPRQICQTEPDRPEIYLAGFRLRSCGLFDRSKNGIVLAVAPKIPAIWTAEGIEGSSRHSDLNIGVVIPRQENGRTSGCAFATSPTECDARLVFHGPSLRLAYACERDPAVRSAINQCPA